MPIWSAEIKELETLLTSIKGWIPDLEKDLEHLIKTDDENVALLYSRRCLEIIVTDLCETELHRPRKTEPLKGIIDKLNREEKVPPHIITSMLSLNSLSTYGTHPKDFDPEQVKPALSNLTIIIKWYLKYKNTRPVSKQSVETVKDETKSPDVSPGSGQIHKGQKKKLVWLLSGLALFVVIVIVALVVFNVTGIRKYYKVDIDLEKSIAVLPFINDSPDEENVYFINGIMEEILNNLQTIRDLRVISRSSVEQYRDATRPTAPEIARKLDVNYIVEGSGQKYGNTFRVRVQLIEAPKDRHLWAESYEQEIKETGDIFRIQTRIAESIAGELKAIITPEEKQLIEKAATTSLTAYDFYQRGREEFSKYSSDNSNREALERAEDYYKKALKYDSTFAQAYTGLSHVYYVKHYFDEYFSQSFLDSVLILADKALSFDDRLSEAYIIRGMYYRESGKPEQAVKEYDKALEFNPNDWMAYYMKGSIYMWVLEDFVKSIENLHEAVIRNRGEELPDLLSSLGRAYLDIGFVDKAKYYYDEVLKLETDSIRFFWNRAWIEFSAENFTEATEFLEKANEIDSTYSIIHPYYTFAGKHQEEYANYTKLIERRKQSGQLSLNFSHRIGYAFWKVGKYKEAEYYFDQQIGYGTEMIKLGRQLSTRMAAQYDLAGVYAFRGEKEKAYQYLDEVNKKKNYPLWWVTMIRHDPLFDSIRDEERFQKIVQNVEAKYQAEHERVRKWLEEKGMI